jgi:serine/threonine protein kinase
MTFSAGSGAKDPRVGTQFGVYHVGALIGSGAVGRVYEASAADGTRVALKLAKPDLAQDETFRRRFRREARIAQKVRHPHVVPVIDSGTQDGILYLAEVFIDGVSLEQKIKLEGRLDVETTVAICSHVADGLQALWAAGIVHRDVKPANILLDRAGNAYITDFGLAKDTQGSLLTRPGQTLGSLDYMAPEQIRGEPVTAASDVYSLGCVVFECVHGAPPFAGREGLRVLWAHLKDEPPDPCPDSADSPSPRFVQALKTALNKPPDERPSSSVEYIRSLSQAAGITVAPGPV